MYVRTNFECWINDNARALPASRGRGEIVFYQTVTRRQGSVVPSLTEAREGRGERRSREDGEPAVGEGMRERENGGEDIVDNHGKAMWNKNKWDFWSSPASLDSCTPVFRRPLQLQVIISPCCYRRGPSEVWSHWMPIYQFFFFYFLCFALLQRPSISWRPLIWRWQITLSWFNLDFC